MSTLQAGATAAGQSLRHGAQQTPLTKTAMQNTGAAPQNMPAQYHSNQNMAMSSAASGPPMMRTNGVASTWPTGNVTPVANGGEIHSGLVSMAEGSTPQSAAKRTYNTMQRQAATANDVNGASAPLPQKHQRFNSRPMTNTFKNQVHAQDAAAKYKAAYNNAGPALVNIVENAAAYFEGKDTPEAVLDKEKSYERYQFNMQMLTEIFDGPLPDDKALGSEENIDAVKTTNSDAKPGDRAVKEQSAREEVLERLGRKVLERSHEERMRELDSRKARFNELESQNRNVEKVNMRLFQKLERAGNMEDIRTIRSEYERLHRVKFADGPEVMIKRELDSSLPELRPERSARILQFP